VLAVDDDPLVLMNTVIILEDLGHTAIGASSGEEALKALEQSPGVDLVVTDYAMPGMTGSQLAAEVHKRSPGMKVVLATGYAELPKGGDTTLIRLAKPFTQDQLAAALAEAVDGQ
jgi:CheY-like chemotaxis protein